MKARTNKEVDEFAGFLLDEVTFITMSTDEDTSAVIIFTNPREVKAELPAETNAASPSEAVRTEFLSEVASIELPREAKAEFPTEAHITKLPSKTKAEFPIEANMIALLNEANTITLQEETYKNTLLKMEASL